MRRIVFALLAVASPAHADDFDPLDGDGWPKNLTLDDLRELPECTAPLPHTPGAPVTCRPGIERGGLQWGLGFDWTTGGVSGTVPTMGGMHAFGVEADFALARTWQVAARYELGGMALPSAMPGVDGGSALTQHFLAMLDYRLFTDEVTRDAWVFGVGGGVALRGDDLGGTAPMLRAALARHIGGFGGGSTAVDAALELAVEHSQLGAARLDAVLASVRLGFETNVRTPEGLGKPAPAQWDHAVSFDIMGGPWFGFGASLAVPVSRHVQLVGSGGFIFDITSDQKVHGFDGAQWAGLAGARLHGDLFYLQAQAGGAWIGKDPEGEAHGIAQGELGIRMFAGCTSAVDLGTWVRDDLYTGDLVAGGLMLRVASGARMRGEASYCGHGQLALAQPPAPPPPVVVTPSPAYEAPVPEVRVPEVQVQVEVPKPEPIVVEVDLGAAIGGFSLRLDPRLLPLARLRGAGFVSIELSGPGDEMAHFTAELQGTLSRNGVRIDAITNGGETSAVFHAKFTIWPPGTRPER
jgi:hypothetical protein